MVKTVNGGNYCPHGYAQFYPILAHNLAHSGLSSYSLIALNVKTLYF